MYFVDIVNFISQSQSQFHNQSARSVRDLGIYLDSDASMKAHVSRTVSSCFNALRQIRSIRRSVAHPVLQSLVVSPVLSRLDCGNAALAGLPNRELSRLSQSRMLVHGSFFSANKNDHVSSLLRDLHWLRVPQQINYKIAVLVYRCLHGLAPAYLSVDTEHQGPTVETTTTVIVVGHVSRPYVKPVRCRRPRFPDCRWTNLEHSVAGCSVIQFFINFQTSAQD